MKKYNKIVAIQGDPIQNINTKTDTTLLLALEAQRRGYKIYYYETKDLTFSHNEVFAFIKEVTFNENKNFFYSIKRSNLFKLSKANFILMRQNPPFNMDYITSTFILEKISNKTKIINNPYSVRNMPEKFYSTKFFKLMPPTIFTKNFDEINQFQKKYKKIIIKPTHGYGGNDILFLKKKINKNIILKYLKKNEHVMIQKFLPQIKYGDKRIFIINGVIKGAIRRVPKKGSILSNISQGGHAFKTSLTKKEFKIAKIIASDLKKSKIFFAGIDLISSYLTGDINITSPTGLKNYLDLTGKNLAIDFWDYLEKK